MSFASVIRVIIVSAAGIAVLGFLASNLGPGMRDVTYEIANGYYYIDAGHYEKSIGYRGTGSKAGTIIDARVDDFVVYEGRLLVARTPRVAYLADDDALRSALSPGCEYWVIDIAEHAVSQVPWLAEVTCR